jgi:maltokinase
MAFEDALAAWLVKQRWFAGKGRELRDLAIVADTEIVSGDPELRHLIVMVSHGTTVDYYQVLEGLRRRLPARLRHARIGPSGDGRQAYDALHDADLTKPLLAGIATDQTIGSLQLRTMPGATFETGLDSLVIGAEQSNTSLVYGEESILKVFRRLSPGPNPDLEVTTALARLGSSHVAEPFGWIETSDGGEVTILAILSRYLRAASDGWSLAATSVRDLYAQPGTSAAEAGGDFAGEAHRLGAATAEVHRDLVTAFGTEEFPAGAAGGLAGPMQHRLEVALAAVPALREYEPLLSRAYAELAALDEPLRVQRIHGDYHLGQAMRTQTGWVVIDFEGEPAVPLATRRAMSSPLRDVAGMLRSFDYAARHQLLGNPERATLELLARDWVRRSREAFCDGYAEVGGADPRESGVLLRAFELDKAVYEVMYEARNRPSWLPIPLDSLAALPVIAAGSGEVESA